MKLLNFDRRDCETLLPVGIFLALIVVIGLFVHFDVLEPQAVQMHDQFLSPSTSLPTGTEIEVGAYIENIYLFSANDKTFDVDGWIWVNRPQEAEDLFQAKKLTPDKWLNFVNQVDEWNSNRLDRATEEEKSAIIEHIDEIDNKFQISLTIFLFVLSAASWFLLYR